VLIEDESGRVRLVGEAIDSGKWKLVTGMYMRTPSYVYSTTDPRSAMSPGIVVSVLGAETPNGGFEVLDLCFPGPPPRPERKMETEDTWVALVSGLEMGGDQADGARCTILQEYLTGEAGGEADRGAMRQVARVAIAGNSMAQPIRMIEEDVDKKAVSLAPFFPSLRKCAY
jgi:DNA polymerase delta subunit 2